jgi:hypothetical protein
MVAASQSYRERMKAQRAAAGVKREAEKAEWRRLMTLIAELTHLYLEAVKPSAHLAPSAAE